MKKKIQRLATEIFGSVFDTKTPVTRQAFQSAPSVEVRLAREKALEKKWRALIKKNLFQQDVIAFVLTLAKYFARIDGNAFVKKKHTSLALKTLTCPLDRKSICKWIIKRPNGEIITLIHILL